MSISEPAQRLATFDKFTAVYCSDFFIDNSSLLTALCLIFDQVHILNPASFVLDILIHSPSEFASESEPPNTTEIKIWLNGGWIPIALPSAQAEAMSNYLLLTKQFWIANAPLQGKVLHSDLFTGREALSTLYGNIDPDVLRDPQRLGQVNFHVSTSSMGIQQLIARMLSRGAVPVFGDNSIQTHNPSAPSTARGIAALLAIQAATMALPSTRPAHADVILEARERLSDYLPAYWAYMLRLSSDFRSHVRDGMPLEEALRECADFIDQQITPILLDTRRKMTMEYTSWFHKIITPVTNGLELAVGKSNLSIADLLAILAKTIGDIAANFVGDDTHHIDTGLAFLIKLHDVGGGS
jgi:hypothetical protein